MEFLGEYGYAGLFIAAFLAATILPLSSEVVLASLLVSGLDPTALVITASIGNCLGALVNYALGYGLSFGSSSRWLKISDEEFQGARQRFQKYGTAALLLAWAPIIGDPLTLLAGFLRVPLLWFIVLVATGKILRYIVITHLVMQAIGV